MDVNPSIEIVTNRLDRVVEINPLNDDAEELLKSFNPKDKNLERTVNDLVDLMILTGHIRGGEDNFVMITVADDSIDSRLVNKVNRAIQAMLENKQIEATVLNQAIASSNREEKLTGVELAAQRIQELDGSLTAERIESMTVKELIHYSKENNIAIESLFKVAVGEINSNAVGQDIISRKEAESIALNKINGEVVKLEFDDLHDDDPEYDIEILANGVIHEIEIDAYTGQVKEFEREDDNYSVLGEENRKIISKEEASNIALGLVNGEIVKLELGEDDDKPEYEIKINVDGVIYEIEIDAITGEIKEFEKEDDSKSTFDHRKHSQSKQHHKHQLTQAEQPTKSQQPKQSQSKTSGRITGEQARAIALQLTGGGSITEFEFDDDEYEIEIKANGKEYEIEIDAYTGKVLDFEVEVDD
jgi:uncharacterized membrane protein YkoI